MADDPRSDEAPRQRPTHPILMVVIGVIAAIAAFAIAYYAP